MIRVYAMNSFARARTVSSFEVPRVDVLPFNLRPLMLHSKMRELSDRPPRQPLKQIHENNNVKFTKII